MDYRPKRGIRFGRRLKGQLNKAENDVEDYNDNDDEEDSELIMTSSDLYNHRYYTLVLKKQILLIILSNKELWNNSKKYSFQLHRSLNSPLV